MLPVAENLSQRGEAAPSAVIACCMATANHPSWRFASKASGDIFRRHFVPGENIGVEAGDIFVVTHVPMLGENLPSIHIVSMAHGSGFGNSGPYSLKRFSASTLYCGISPAEAEYFARHLGAPPPAGRFIATGVPRNDRFAPFLALAPDECAEAQRRLKAQIGLAADKPLILLASHWTPDGILRSFGCDIIDALAPLADACEIVQTAHPVLWADPQYDSFNPDAERPSQEGFSSATIRSQLDARHKAGTAKVMYDIESPALLMAADLLIGDFSSIVIEFSLFDRPILFYDVPERFHDSTVHDLYAGAGAPFRHARDVLPLVRHALANPAEKSEGRRRLSAHFNYNIGGAAEAVADAIVGLPLAPPAA